MVANQAEAAKFIELSQKKALGGLNFYAFFNNKLVSSPTILSGISFRTLTDFSSKKVRVETLLKLALLKRKKETKIRTISLRKH